VQLGAKSSGDTPFVFMSTIFIRLCRAITSLRAINRRRSVPSWSAVKAWGQVRLLFFCSHYTEVMNALSTGLCTEGVFIDK